VCGPAPFAGKRGDAHAGIGRRSAGGRGLHQRDRAVDRAHELAQPAADASRVVDVQLRAAVRPARDRLLRAVPFGLELVTLTTGEPLLIAAARHAETSCRVVNVADDFYLHAATEAGWTITLRPSEGEVVCPAD
jgi:hypothetical protein